MNGTTDEDARAALAAIERGRSTVIDEIDMPAWYWWGLAIGWVVVGVLTDLDRPVARRRRRPSLFGACHAAAAQRVLDGRHRSDQLSVRADVVGRHVPAPRHRQPDADGRAHRGARAARRRRRLRAPGHRGEHRRRAADPRRRPAPDGGRPPAGRSAAAAPMTEPRFDEVIHPSTRLSIVALLAAADWVDFAFVRDRLGLSDSALSKQFATLESAGYLTQERQTSERRRRVRVRLTDEGRTRSTATSPRCARSSPPATPRRHARADPVSRRRRGGGRGSRAPSRRRSRTRPRWRRRPAAT